MLSAFAVQRAKSQGFIGAMNLLEQNRPESKAMITISPISKNPLTYQ
jgi:hypothetical protein